MSSNHKVLKDLWFNKKIMYKLIIISLIFFFMPLLWKGSGDKANAQNKKIDSLLTLLKTDKADTNKVKHLNNLGQEYINIRSLDTALKQYNAELQLAQKLNFKKGIVNSYTKIGTIYLFQTNYIKALENWGKALKIVEEMKDKTRMPFLLNNIGFIYDHQGNFPKALDYKLSALKIAEELGNKKEIETACINIGSTYFDQKDYPKALDYFFEAFKIAKKLGDKRIMAFAIGDVGDIYNIQKKYSEAQNYYLKALKMAEEISDENEIAFHLRNLGNLYAEQKIYLKALDYYFKSLNMAKAGKDKNVIATTLSIIGSLHIKIGKFKEAEQYLKNAIALQDSLGTLDGLRQTEELMSQLYDTTGQPKLALIYYKKAIALKDTIYSQENKKQLVRKEMNYEFDKKEAITKAENDKQQAIAEEKNHQQKIVIWSVAFGLFLVIVFAGFVFRSLRITRKQKNVIEVQKNEVTKQKDIADSQRIIAVELREISENQKHIVEEKQKEILDSITYASRIQRALLTSSEYIAGNLSAEHFILFKPKDIVSGDFYWALRTTPPAGEAGKGIFYIAASDCTGHGVPGAFMSMLNISYFNENVIERGIRMPDDILNAQRNEIIKALNPPGSTEVSKDGMDCILCAYDFDKMLLHFAAANNPLWLVREKSLKLKVESSDLMENNSELKTQNFELIEYKADKMPVGKYTEEMLPFTLQTIELQKGDIIYASTDGFADQFGINGKKMMKKKFKEELLKIHHLSMSEQKEYLDNFFENWKGKAEQVDDVCIIGIRI